VACWPDSAALPSTPSCDHARAVAVSGSAPRHDEQKDSAPRPSIANGLHQTLGFTPLQVVATLVVGMAIPADYTVCVVDGEPLQRVTLTYIEVGLRRLIELLERHRVDAVGIERPDGPVVDALLGAATAGSRGHSTPRRGSGPAAATGYRRRTTTAS
jgi:hypothetical protein